MKTFILTITFLLTSIFQLYSSETEITVKELKNFGSEYVGKQVKLIAEFEELDQLWVMDLPWVSSSAQKASEWIGFSIFETREKGDTKFVLCFASKDKFKDILNSLNMGSARQDGDIIELSGVVFDFMSNNLFGLEVQKITLIKKGELKSNYSKDQPAPKMLINNSEKKENLKLPVNTTLFNNLPFCIIVVFAGFVVGVLIGYFIRKK